MRRAGIFLCCVFALLLLHIPFRGCAKHGRRLVCKVKRAQASETIGQRSRAPSTSMESLTTIFSYDSANDSSSDEVTLDSDGGPRPQTFHGVDADSAEHAEPASKKQRVLLCPPTADAEVELCHPVSPQISNDGRVRSFPHVEGNYAGFVYVPMRGIDGLEVAAVKATAMAEEVLNKGWKRGQTTEKQHLLHRIPVPELHMSVSRTFAVRRNQIRPVVDRIRSCLTGVPSFDAAVAGIDLYSNDEKTRSFVGLSLSLGVMRMITTTRAVDHALGAFSIRPFYEEMRFHVSVAWFAGPVPEGVPLTLADDRFVSGAETQTGIGKTSDETQAEELAVARAQKGRRPPSKTVKASAAPQVPHQVCFAVKSLEAKIGAKKYTFKLKD